MSSISSEPDNNLSEPASLNEWVPDFPVYTYKDRPQFSQPKSIKPFAMIIAASRNQGKSVLFKRLYEDHFRDKMDLVIVFSSTLGNGFYDDFIESKTKYTNYDEEVIYNLFNIQESVKKAKGYYLNTLVIFDDIVGDQIKHSEAIQDLFVLGRHRNISIAFLTQSPVLCKTTWRQNCTHLFLLRCKGSGLDHIIQGFLLDLVDDEDSTEMKPERYLRKILKSVFSEKYKSIVVEFDKEGNSLQDCMTSYKANPKFRKR
jgi:hypothetical protein